MFVACRFAEFHRALTIFKVLTHLHHTHRHRIAVIWLTNISDIYTKHPTHTHTNTHTILSISLFCSSASVLGLSMCCRGTFPFICFLFFSSLLLLLFIVFCFFFVFFSSFHKKKILLFFLAFDYSLIYSPFFFHFILLGSLQLSNIDSKC